MNRTIMVVDDDTLITSTLSNLLEVMLDCEIIVYNDPIEALKDDRLLNNKVDMVISDFLMPKINGLEMLKSVHEMNPKCINILLTGYADKQNAIKCINEIELYYYVEKPWDNSDLIKIIENGFEKKLLETELEMKLVEIEKSNHEISRLYSLLKTDYDKELDKNTSLSQWNSELEQAVVQRTFALQNLLDNVGQGFLTFGDNITVDKDYSFECINIFRKRIENIKFPELIYPNNDEERTFLENILREILSEDDTDKLDLYLPLLPNEVLINNRNILLDFKLVSKELIKHIEISSDVFMVVLTDITDKRELESKIEKEKNILKMVVGAVVNYRDLIDTIKDYKLFCQNKIYELMDINDPLKDRVIELYRSIHTYKGTFSQLQLVGITKVLHNFEDKIYEFQQDLNNKTDLDFKNLLDRFNLTSLLDDDLEVLVKYLGQNFMNQDDLLLLDKSLIIEIEKKVIDTFPSGQIEELLMDLHKLRFKPFKDLIKSYSSYVEKLSEELNKPMNPLIISSDEILIDTDMYYDFSKSLIHIFRNLIHHGIEDIEEREHLNKSYFGTAKCSVKEADDLIIIKISDDGAGVNIDKIKEKAISKKLISREEISEFNESQILDLIFLDGFSTVDNVSNISGRGVGLAAVKHEVSRLNGEIKVKTVLNKGTEFEIRIPYKKYYSFLKPSPEKLFLPFVSSTIEFIKSNTGVIMECDNVISIDASERVELKNVTASITFKGFLNGMFSVTADESLLRKITTEFLIEEIKEEEEKIFFQEILAEYINTVLGNSIREVIGDEKFVSISVPVTMYSEKALIKYSESDILSCNLRSSYGGMTLSFITSDKTN